MKLRKFTGFALSLIMAISSLSVSFADGMDRADANETLIEDTVVSESAVEIYVDDLKTANKIPQVKYPMLSNSCLVTDDGTAYLLNSDKYVKTDIKNVSSYISGLITTLDGNIYDIDANGNLIKDYGLSDAVKICLYDQKGDSQYLSTDGNIRDYFDGSYRFGNGDIADLDHIIFNDLIEYTNGKIVYSYYNYNSGPKEILISDSIDAKQICDSYIGELILSEDGTLYVFAMPSEEDVSSGAYEIKLLSSISNISKISRSVGAIVQEGDNGSIFYEQIYILKNDGTIMYTININSSTDENIFTQFDDLKNVIDVSVDGETAYAIIDDGSIWYWKSRPDYIPSQPNYITSPVKIEGLNAFSKKAETTTVTDTSTTTEIQTETTTATTTVTDTTVTTQIPVVSTETQTEATTAATTTATDATVTTQIPVVPTETQTETTVITTLKADTETTTIIITETDTETTTAAVAESSSETTTRRTTSGGGGGGSYKPKTTTTTEASTETTTASKAKEKVTEKEIEKTTQAPKEDNISKEVRVSIGSSVISVGGSNFTVDAAPYIQTESNSTLVPLHFAAIAISGESLKKADSSSIISWDAVTKTATVKAGGKFVSFTAGSTDMVIDGKYVTMENGVKAEIKDGRMYIPFRALGDALCVNVDWDAETKTAIYSIK